MEPSAFSDSRIRDVRTSRTSALDPVEFVIEPFLLQQFAGYYGKGDFTETLHIITMCGLDADCNAGVLMPVLGISKGIGSIPERYMRPVFGTLTTYMRGDYSEIPLDRLVDMTVAAAAGARKR